MLLMYRIEDDAIYGNKMPQVADNDIEDEFETDSESKKTMTTKKLYSQTKGSFRSYHLNKSHWPTMIYMHIPLAISEICVCW